MVGHCRRELSYLAAGFHDAIPKAALAAGGAACRLSAIDLELLVCGIPSIDVAVIMTTPHTHTDTTVARR